MITELIEKAIGRELTETEQETLRRMSDWDVETKINVLGLILAAYTQGRKVERRFWVS